MTDTTGEPGPESIGSVAEEAARLLGAVSDWARDHGTDLGAGLSGLVDHAAAGAHDVDEHLATGGPECTYCPVCRAVHLVRGTSPEVRQHLAVAAASLMQAAAGVLATVVPDDARARHARGDGVERIDLDDEPGEPS